MTTENDITLLETDEKRYKKIMESLEIEEPIEDVVAEENGEAVFECKVDGHPQPICTWHKNGKLITSSQRTKITSNRKWHRLEIRKVNTADYGIYSIVCRNSSKQISSKAILYIANRKLSDEVCYSHSNSKGSQVVKHLRNVKVTKGDRIELEVTFQLEAIDDYVWFKNNEVIYQDTRTIILNSKVTSILSIMKSELSDAGVYFVVSKTKHGVVSSFADVQVTVVKESSNDSELLPFIEELLPDEVETNEGEDIKLICKAAFDINTSTQWRKNNSVLDKDNFVEVDYGNHWIGLRGVKVSRTDAGEYSVVLRDEVTGREETSSCFVTVNPSPQKCPPIVALRRSLESIVACCGSRVSFDCSFALEDPTYFYVVWHVGRYRVERTNSRFSVIFQGGEFLLCIRSLEPGMAGEVVCELRRALPNQRSVHVNSTTAQLAIVPRRIVLDEKKSSSEKGKLFSTCSLYSAEIVVAPWTGFSKNPEKSTNGNGCVMNGIQSEVILEITYCRLDESGLYFLHASRGDSDVVTSRLFVNVKTTKRDSGMDADNTLVIEWDDSIMPTTLWYALELGQDDGGFICAGVISQPFFEIQGPPLRRMMRFRIKTVPPPSDINDSSLCIEPAPETILKSPKNHELRPMDDFEPLYTKTGDLIGCGAFGSVVLVRDRVGQHYAAKVLKTRTQKKRDTAMREFEMMKMLRHPKLVELIDAFVSKDVFILVMDYLWGGELFDRIVEEEHIKEVDVVPYVRQICEALEYLHTYKIAHLDLKPENIICLSPNSGQVKIIDFGLARVLEEGNITRAIYGTRDYVAPEVLNFERLTLACDMWSLGVVTYMLVSGVMPFSGDTWPERSANITMANYNYDETAFREISQLAKDFVDQLLVLTADKRLSAKEALNHKWIKEGPPKGAKAGHMKRARENLKSYLANYRARWQRAGNVMIAAHRLRTHAGSQRASAERTSPSDT